MKNPLMNFIISWFCPTVITKIFILYFGLNYSSYPGEGYGYGLAATITFTILMLGRFVYRYWGQEEF